jgi:hypothetical protein
VFRQFVDEQGASLGFGGQQLPDSPPCHGAIDSQKKQARRRHGERSQQPSSH